MNDSSLLSGSWWSSWKPHRLANRINQISFTHMSAVWDFRWLGGWWQYMQMAIHVAQASSWRDGAWWPTIVVCLALSGKPEEGSARSGWLDHSPKASSMCSEMEVNSMSNKSRVFLPQLCLYTQLLPCCSHWASLSSAQTQGGGILALHSMAESVSHAGRWTGENRYAR